MYYLTSKSTPLCFPLPVYNQQVGPYIRALGEGLMPGSQQIDIADQPVTAAREAQPARRTDGWMWGAGKWSELNALNRNNFIGLWTMKTWLRFGVFSIQIQLTVQGPFTHVRTLVSALMGSPFPKFICCVLDYRGTWASLWVAVGKCIV